LAWESRRCASITAIRMGAIRVTAEVIAVRLLAAQKAASISPVRRIARPVPITVILNGGRPLKILARHQRRKAKISVPERHSE